MTLVLTSANAAPLLAAVDRLAEAVSRVSKERALAPIEGRLELAMARAFRAQAAAFWTAYRVRRRRLQEAEGDEWDDLMGRAEQATIELMPGPLDDAAAAALSAGAKSVIAELGVKLKFDLQNPRAVRYLAEHGAARVSGINDATRAQLRTIITDGVAAGWSPDKIARAITTKYRAFATPSPLQHIRSRAHLIAVSEAGDGYEAGSLEAAEQMTTETFQLEHSWLTVGDDRVSAMDRSNQAAGWIPLAQAFPSGHTRPLSHPGCRCTARYRRANVNESRVDVAAQPRPSAAAGS